MTEENCRSTMDPYTGTQFVYDYLLCRHGKDTSDKHSNLILSFPYISKTVWTKSNQNKSSLKSALWYATADIIVLKDGIIQCVNNVCICAQERCYFRKGKHVCQKKILFIKRYTYQIGIFNQCFFVSCVILNVFVGYYEVIKLPCNLGAEMTWPSHQHPLWIGED